MKNLDITIHSPFKVFIVFAILIIPLKLWTQNVGPLLETNWNQKHPFNFEIPEMDTYLVGEIRPNAGCGAIALAQVLNYFNYPLNPAGVIEYNFWGDPKYIIAFSSVSVNLNSITYNWDNIDEENNTYENTPDGELNNLIIEETANLIYHAGATQKTKYGSNTSISKTTELRKALVSNFGYSNSATILNRAGNCISGLTKEEFLSSIKFEIDRYRPVILYGKDNDSNSAHFMVVDGYSNESDYVHINIGFRDARNNSWYDLDDVSPQFPEPTEYNFSDCQSIIVNIYPFNETYLPPWQNLNSNSNPKRNSAMTIPCANMIYPLTGQHGVSSEISLAWEDDPQAVDYLVTIKALGNNILFYDSVSTYAGGNLFSGPELLPFNDSIQVTVNPIDIDGNIYYCEPFIFFTDTMQCDLVIQDAISQCISDSTYQIEVFFTGLLQHTYDLWAEDTAGVIISLNGIAPGNYILGPISSSKNVAIVLEDEAEPYDCNDGDMVIAPNCVTCSTIDIDIESVYCNDEDYNVTLQLTTDSSTIIDLYTGIPGIITHNDVSSGTYTFNSIPIGTDIIVIAEDTSKPYDCYLLQSISSPTCNGDNASTHITTLEYFIDNDPGFGEATNIPVPDSYDFIINYNISLSNISPGVHVLYIRAKDENDHWGFTQRKLFYVRENPETGNEILTDLEYFVDIDPGFGNGNPLTLESNTNSIENYNLPLSALDPGVHVLYVRAKDSAEKWSFTQRKLFYIRENPETGNEILIDLEYFVDTDPGFGNGNQLTIENSSNSIESYNLPLSSLDPGVHVLYVRAKDSAGKWSFTQRKLFYIRENTESENEILTDLEYFVDTDPGYGNGNPLELENDSNSIASYNVPLASLPSGQHTLFVRAKDSSGRWGFTAVKTFTIYIIGSVIYVDWDATGQNIGTSWTNAFTNLQSALYLASEYDTIQEIWIAQGNYYPINSSDRNTSFVFTGNNVLYGGFLGNETDRSQRTTNPSLVVLSGDIGVQGENGDNSYHVVKGDPTCENCLLDRLSIKLGNANIQNNNNDVGAGVLNFGNMDLSDVIIENSSSISQGAAIFNSGLNADLRIMNCIFRFNNSGLPGDIYNSGGSNIDFLGSNVLQY